MSKAFGVIVASLIAVGVIMLVISFLLGTAYVLVRTWQAVLG